MLATVLVLAACLQYGSTLQPRTYTSPSGEWELFVDPSDRGGAGPSRCVSSRGGNEVWSAELPFTFRAAVIDDRGVAAGFALTEGETGYSAKGDLLVVILSEAGAVAFEERIERTPGPGMHSSPDPNVKGMLLQPRLRRLVLRVSDHETARELESWWSYDLGAPGLLSKVVPVEERDDESYWGPWSLAARAVPGTPLIVSQWYQRDDARFLLLDAELEKVWSLVLPGDYADEDGDDPFYEMRDSGGAILSAEDGRFDLRFWAENRRVRFAVYPDPEPEGGWVVSELSREPFAPEEDEVALPAIEDLEPRLVATVALETGVADEPFVRDVIEFDVAAGGEIRFLRDEGGGVTQVRLAPDGALVDELSLDPAPLAGDVGTVWAALPGEAWVLSVSNWDENESDVLWRYDGRTGRARRLPVSGMGRVQEMAGFPGGVVIGDWRGKNYRWHTLHCFDLDGRPVWSVNTEEASQRLPLDGLAVHDSGRCAVVGSVSHEIHVFGPAGVPEAVLDLDQLLSAPLNYPSGLHADTDGGWLLRDFNGEPPVRRLAADGSSVAGVTPRFDDGREAPLTRALRRAGDGALWTTDGTALYELNDAGVVARTVGAAPETAALTEPRRVQVDRLGRVLVQDRRTGALHVFDVSGARTALAPYPEEHERAIGAGRYISVRDDGRLLVPVGGKNLEYGPDGTLMGETDLPLRHTRFQPGLGSAWGFLDGKLTRVDADGRVLRTLARFPDGQWLGGGEIAVGPDGSLVVRGGVRGEDFGRLVHYDAEGEARDTWRIPPEVRGDPHVRGGRVLLDSYGPVVHLVDLADGALRRVSVDRPGQEEATWSHGLSPDGDELWAVSWKTLELFRFALPER